MAAGEPSSARAQTAAIAGETEAYNDAHSLVRALGPSIPSDLEFMAWSLLLLYYHARVCDHLLTSS